MSSKVQNNAIARVQVKLRAIRNGELTFKSYLGFDHSKWLEIIDFLLVKLHEEIMLDAYYDHIYGPLRPYPEPSFDEWLLAIKKRNGGG